MADADPARACLLVSSGPSPRESTRVVHTDQRGAASAPRGVGNAPFGREGRHNFSPCRFRLPPFPSTRSVLFTLDQYNQLNAFSSGTTGQHGKRLAGLLSGKSNAEFQSLIAQEGITPTPVNLPAGVGGIPPAQTMLRYEFSDGTVVRYKPHGNDASTKPVFTVAVKKDPGAPDTGPTDAAFKVDAQGRAVPRGDKEKDHIACPFTHPGQKQAYLDHVMSLVHHKLH